ncbi:unnamed protein product, partial [marine sediment metagenome]
LEFYNVKISNPVARPKKPIEKKKLEGTFRKDREAKEPMVPTKFEGIPKPPKQLIKEGMDLWNAAVKELQNLKMLYDVDLPMLVSYCNEMGTYFKMQDIINKKGETYMDGKNPKTRPEVYIGRNSLKIAITIASKFGFTPSDRTKIEVPKQNEGDAFSEFENN